MGSPRLTTEEFIAHAREVHGDRYDYSLVEYENNKKKVKVICKEHGVFDAIPSAHKKGAHCAKCQGQVKITVPEFLHRSKVVHGDTYDYRLVSEIHSNRTKVPLICAKHGEFSISVAWHLRGKGCQRCSGKNRDKTTPEFIQDAVEVWGDTYTYGKAEYIGSKSPIQVTCSVHGDFTTTPNGLLRGYGCPKCGGSELQTTEQFIAAARLVHGDEYDYSQSDYINNRTNVDIICKKHGVFPQTPRNHKSGQGCPACSENGFNSSQPAWLYVIGIYGERGEYVGFGITKDLEFRLKTHTRSLIEHGMSLTLLHSKFYEHGRDALDTETAIKQLLPVTDLGVDGFRRECVDNSYRDALLSLVV